MTKSWMGASWYPSGRWRVNLGYGVAKLDRLGDDGTLHQVLARVQYIFPGAHK